MCACACACACAWGMGGVSPSLAVGDRSACVRLREGGVDLVLVDSAGHGFLAAHTSLMLDAMCACGLWRKAVQWSCPVLPSKTKATVGYLIHNTWASGVAVGYMQLMYNM